MATLQNGVNTTTENMVVVTIAPGKDKRLTRKVGAFNYVYTEGDTVKVSKFEEAQLRRDGVIV
jgi:hypothetical protein